MIYFVLEKPFFTRFQNLRASNKKSFLDNQLSFLRTYTHTHTNKEVQNISGMKYSLTRKQIDYFYRMPPDVSRGKTSAASPICAFTFLDLMTSLVSEELCALADFPRCHIYLFHVNLLRMQFKCTSATL